MGGECCRYDENTLCFRKSGFYYNLQSTWSLKHCSPFYLDFYWGSFLKLTCTAKQPCLLPCTLPSVFIWTVKLEHFICLCAPELWMWDQCVIWDNSTECHLLFFLRICYRLEMKALCTRHDQKYTCFVEHLIPKSRALICSSSLLGCYNSLHSSGKAFL
jgi:hypothetical protein